MKNIINTLPNITNNSLFEAFDYAIDPIAITDANLKSGVKFLFVNNAFTQETGYTKEIYTK